MEAACYTETSAFAFKTTRYHNPEYDDQKGWGHLIMKLT
jgi:hypothetical protein